MNFQVFHVNPGKKLKKKDVNNNLSHFMSVFPTACVASFEGKITFIRDHCKTGFKKVYWWQWGQPCWARCCKSWVKGGDGGDSAFDNYCGPWTR